MYRQLVVLEEELGGPSCACVIEKNKHRVVEIAYKGVVDGATVRGKQERDRLFTESERGDEAKVYNPKTRSH